MPRKGQGELAPTLVPSPDQKNNIKKWAIWYKTFLLFRCDEGKVEKVRGAQVKLTGRACNCFFFLVTFVR